MVNRLVDWIDTTLPEGSSFPTRVAVYGQMHEQISRHLLHAMEHLAIVIDDVPRAAAFWLDCLIGHIRGLPLEGVHWEEWQSNYIRYFLRTVCQEPQGALLLEAGRLMEDISPEFAIKLPDAAEGVRARIMVLETAADDLLALAAAARALLRSSPE